MKFALRTALVCSITASFSLAVACGSNDSSGLFSTGGIGASNGGSFANGGSSAHAGQANGGSNSNRGGSTSTSGGHANGGGNSAGTTSSGGSNQAGTGAGGDSGGTTAMGGAAMGGGSAGTEAAGSGGSTAGTGGTSAGAGGMSGGGAGGAVGGSGGSGGSGGVNGCPQNGPPQDGAPCVVSTPDSCYYPGEACSCLQDQQGPGKHWGCYGTPGKCPIGAAPHPTDGASCKGYSGGLCPYSATDFCACIPAFGGGEPKWGCNQSDTCPALRPQGTFCVSVEECTYGDRACFCSGSVWGCE